MSNAKPSAYHNDLRLIMFTRGVQKALKVKLTNDVVDVLTYIPMSIAELQDIRRCSDEVFADKFFLLLSKRLGQVLDN